MVGVLSLCVVEEECRARSQSDNEDVVAMKSKKPEGLQCPLPRVVLATSTDEYCLCFLWGDANNTRSRAGSYSNRAHLARPENETFERP